MAEISGNPEVLAYAAADRRVVSKSVAFCGDASVDERKSSATTAASDPGPDPITVAAAGGDGDHDYFEAG
jgi:hypothetical protein